MSPSASRPSAPRPHSPSGPHSSPSRGSHAETGRLLLLQGSSERLTNLRRWLVRFWPGGDALRVQELEDLGDLFDSRLLAVSVVTLFVDAEDLPLEEVGLLKRWLDRVSGARLVLVGAPEESPGAQRLWEESQLPSVKPLGAEGQQKASRAEWLPFPPDIPCLEALLEDHCSGEEVGAAHGQAVRGRAIESPTRRTEIQPTRVERAAESGDRERDSDPVAAELAELREIEFILGRPGPQNVEDTPNLAHSSAPPVASPPSSFPEPEERPAEGAAESSAERPTELTRVDAPHESISIDDDPLAAALEAAARRSGPLVGGSEQSGGEVVRDADEERIANFLRGLDMEARKPRTASEEEREQELSREGDTTEVSQLEEAPSEREAEERESASSASLEGSQEDPAGIPPSEAALPSTVEPHQRHAPWFKDQVADLADIAQRIELGLSAARSADFEATLQTAFPAPPKATPVGGEETVPGETGEEDRSLSDRKLSVRLDELELEVLRLSQFTRTLGFLASPPPQGMQVLDLRSLVSEWVQAQAAQAGGGQENGRPEGAPRFLLRVDEELEILSDKSLLSQAFDALFYVARRATPPGQAIRVRVHLVNDLPAGEPRQAETTIEFERGLLADRTPEEICRPYALRRVLPELGPNALSAARSILEGQGGRILLEDVGAGRMAWRVRLQLSN